MNNYHIVIRGEPDKTASIVCLHCGDIYRPTMPISVARLCAVNDAMQSLHGDCKEKDKP